MLVLDRVWVWVYIPWLAATSVTAALTSWTTAAEFGFLSLPMHRPCPYPGKLGWRISQWTITCKVGMYLANHNLYHQLHTSGDTQKHLDSRRGGVECCNTLNPRNTYNLQQPLSRHKLHILAQISLSQKPNKGVLFMQFVDKWHFDGCNKQLRQLQVDMCLANLDCIIRFRLQDIHRTIWAPSDTELDV